MAKSKERSLAPASDQAQPRRNDAALHIPVTLIDPNPHQPRHEITSEDVAELTASIQAVGLLEPLVVCPGSPRSREGGNPSPLASLSRDSAIPSRFTLIAGHRRLAASKLAGLEEVPCVVREGSDIEMLELALEENLQRVDLTFIEEAETYQKLSDLTGYDARSIAMKLGRSPSVIYERLALLKLPKDLQDLVAGRRLPIRAALELGKVANEKRRARLAREAQGLEPDELKTLVRRLLERAKVPRKKRESRAAHPTFQALFDGLPVKRVYKGQVTFQFDDEEQFFSALKTVLERHAEEHKFEIGA